MPVSKKDILEILYKRRERLQRLIDKLEAMPDPPNYDQVLEDL